jgi:hypothetical protein
MANKFGVPKLSAEQVKTLPIFATLTPHQKTYALAIIAGAASPVAYAAAFPSATPDTAARACHAPLRSKKIQKLLGAAFGVRDSRQEFLDDLDAIISNDHATAAQVSALVIRGKILGLLDRDWNPEAYLQSLDRRYFPGLANLDDAEGRDA